MPAHNKLPVRKKTAIATNAAIGNAKRKPMTTMAIKPITSRIISSHQKPGSEGLKLIVCNANKNFFTLMLYFCLKESIYKVLLLWSDSHIVLKIFPSYSGSSDLNRLNNKQKRKHFIRDRYIHTTNRIFIESDLYQKKSNMKNSAQI